MLILKEINEFCSCPKYLRKPYLFNNQICGTCAKIRSKLVYASYK